MFICRTIQNCHFSSFHNYKGSLICVGIFFKEDEKFITLCIQDKISCQHIITRYCGVLVLLQRVAQALLMSYGPAA